MLKDRIAAQMKAASRWMPGKQDVAILVAAEAIICGALYGFGLIMGGF